MNMAQDRWPQAVTQAKALRVALVLLPGCDLLSIAAAADPLHAAGARVQRLSVDGAAVATAAGPKVAVDGQVRQMAGVDLVVVLGGAAGADARLGAVLATAHARGARICAVGAAVLTAAAAGLLQDRRFSLPPGVAAIAGLTPSPLPFCIDGPVATCPEGPVVADVILHLLRDLRGADCLPQVLRGCMLAPPRKADDLPRPTPDLPPVLQRTLRLLAARFASPGPLVQAEALTGLSRRHLERLFRTHLGTSPSRHLQELRLSAARRLLAETTRDIADIARATGFGSTAHFSRIYRRRFGQSPHDLGAGL